MTNNEKSQFHVGQYVVYVNGDKYELGRITSLHGECAFVCYGEGETAALTPCRTMHPLINDYTIKHTSLGGGRFADMENCDNEDS